MVKDHSGDERRNPLPPNHDLLFPSSSKGLLSAPSHIHNRSLHTTAFAKLGVALVENFVLRSRCCVFKNI